MRTRLWIVLLLALLVAPARAADVQLDTEANPSTPASGSATFFFNSTNKELQTIDDGGNVKTLRVLTNQGATTTAGADIYIIGSNITVPTQLVRVGTVFRWTLNMSKTAACTSQPIVNVRVGTTGLIGDTARVTATLPSAQTAATDNGVLTVTCMVTTAGASGILNCGGHLTHTNSSTGFSATAGNDFGPTASSAFDMTVASLQFGLSINPGNTGANAVWTIQTLAEGLNL